MEWIQDQGLYKHLFTYIDLVQDLYPAAAEERYRHIHPVYAVAKHQ